MKSKVTSFYDYRNVVIPEEFRFHRVTDEEIDSRLETLRRNRPVESHPETAESGDSVLCRLDCLDGRVAPVYPGQGMLDGENTVIGMKPGETKDGFTVLEITRLNAELSGDELIREEHIENVSTVEEYRAYWREKEEQERRIAALKRASGYVGQQVLERSEFAPDEAEVSALAEKLGKTMYEAMVKAGMDPTAFVTGTDHPTKEDALAAMIAENRKQVPKIVLDLYYATEIHPITEEQRRVKYEELKAALKKNDEELLEYAGDVMIEDYICGSVLSDDMNAYVKQQLESDKEW